MFSERRKVRPKFEKEFNEHELVARVRTGEKAAFDSLCRHYYSIVMYRTLSMVRIEEVARDITQETFLRAWKNLPTFDFERGSFGGWILHIAQNYTIDILRKKVREDRTARHSADYEQPAVSIDPLHEVIMRQDMQTINSLLTPEKQCILYLRHFKDMDIGEIAKEMNIPEGTVMSRLFYIHKMLREQLSQKKK